MKWVLNSKKGTTINHPSVGRMEGLVAYEVTDHVGEQLKHIINVVVFDRVVPMKVEKNGSNISTD